MGKHCHKQKQSEQQLNFTAWNSVTDMQYKIFIKYKDILEELPSKIKANFSYIVF